MDLKPEVQRVIADLRREGFAVALFNPEELQGADVDHVEERMISGGWDAIEALTDPDYEEE